MTNKIEIRNELEALIRTHFTPKCGWDYYKECSSPDGTPEHASCDDAIKIIKLLDQLCVYDTMQAREIDIIKEYDNILRQLEIIRDEICAFEKKPKGKKK